MKKLIISISLLLILALVLGTIGCAGDNNDEEKIRELVDEQIDALNNVDLETVYDQRSPSYHSRVSLQEFEAFFEVLYADIMPLVQSGDMSVTMTDLEISIEDDYAYVTGNLELDGTVMLQYTEESPDIWQKIDGDWYNLEVNPLFPGYDPSELP